MFHNSDLLSNKKGIVIGIANHHSIAWGIAQAASASGATLALSYQGTRLEEKVKTLAKEINAPLVEELDVSEEDKIKKFIDSVKNQFGKIDFIVHSIAYSKKEELAGRYIDSSLSNFLNSMHISCFSLVQIAKYAEEILNDGASILTLSYYGAEKVIPNYNIMGVAKAALETSVKYLANDLGPKNIRINAISAGPINTLSANVISGFKGMLPQYKNIAPLRRNVSHSDISNTALYFLSRLSSGVTGEIQHVDCGYNIMGMSSG